MDFRGNTFAVQGQGTIYVYLEEKIHRKKLLRFFEKPRKFSPFTVFILLSSIVYGVVIIANLM